MALLDGELVEIPRSHDHPCCPLLEPKIPFHFLLGQEARKSDQNQIAMIEKSKGALFYE